MGALADALVQRGGYNRIDAENAERGPRAAELAREFLGTSGGGGGRGVFNFDYAGEAQKAYGELGAYYDRLLRESEGDLNKVLARLTEDYARGVRIKTRNTDLSRENLDIAQRIQDKQQAQAVERGQGSLISRGLLSRSYYAPATETNPYGVGSTLLNNLIEPFTQRTKARARQRTALDTGLQDYVEQYGPTGVLLTRKTADVAEAKARKKANLEQSRRTSAASLANTRGSQAYNRYLAENQTF